MSKRGASVQGSKDGSFAGDGSAEVSMDDTPRRATAAQMANRKIRQLPKDKLAKNRHVHAGDSVLRGNTQSQQPLPAFSFGQSQGGNLSGPSSASLSFPPNGTASPDKAVASASFPAFGGSSGFNFSPAPPASTFNFSAGPSTNNPFGMAKDKPSTTSTVNGTKANPFGSGNIFSFSAASDAHNAQPAKAPASPASATSPPKPFTPMTFPKTPQAASTTRTTLKPDYQDEDTGKKRKVFSPSDDSMHTSPDASFGNFAASVPPPTSYVATAQPQSNAQSATSNLFERITGATAAAGTSTLGAQDKPAPDAAIAQAGDVNPSQGQPPTSTAGLGLGFGIPSANVSAFPSAVNAQLPATSFGLNSMTSNREGSTPKGSISSDPFTSAANPAFDLSTTTTPSQAPGISAKSFSLFDYASQAERNGIALSRTLSKSDPASAPSGANAPTDQALNKVPFSNLNENQTKSYENGYTLKNLNIGLREHVSRQDPNADWSDIMNYYLSEAAKIVKENQGSFPTSSETAKGLAQAPNDSFSSSSNKENGRPSSSVLNRSSTGFGGTSDLSSKRKADEELTPNGVGSVGHLKKAKPDAGSSIFNTKTSFQSPTTSQTSSFLKSIIDRPEHNDVAKQSSSTNNVFASSKPSTLSKEDTSKAPAAADTAVKNSFGSLPSAFGSQNTPKPPSTADASIKTPFSSFPSGKQDTPKAPATADTTVKNPFGTPSSALNNQDAPKAPAAADNSVKKPFGNLPPAPSGNSFGVKLADKAGPAETAQQNGKPAAASPFAFKPFIPSAPTNDSSSPQPFKPFNSQSAATASAGTLTSSSNGAAPSLFKPVVATAEGQASAVPSNSFTFKPTTEGQPPSTGTPGVQLPKFNVPAGSNNFMGQFGQMAAKEADKEKAKRKAEDFDSDEDDEAEWERKYEEEQRAKKAKIEEEAKKARELKPQLVGGKFVFGSANSSAATEKKETPSLQANSHNPPEAPKTSQPTDSGVFFSRAASPALSTSGGASVFDSPRLGASTAITSGNIFAHLSDVESNAGGKHGRGDDEDSISENELNGVPKGPGQAAGSNGRVEKPSTQTKRARETESDDGESLEDAMRRAAKATASSKLETSTATAAASGRSLFDRVSMGVDGKPEREVSKNDEKKMDGSAESREDDKQDGSKADAPKEVDSPNMSSLFGHSSSLGSSLFGRSSSPAGDNTWKADSPIKFGASTPFKFSGGAAPTFSFTPATPSQAFGASSESSAESRPFGHLLGANKQNSDMSTPTTKFGDAATSTLANVGFSFGVPKPTGGSFLSFPPAPGSSVLGSAPTSRATTPGITTDAGESADSNAEGEPAEVPDPQQDLTALSDTERREEDVLFEGRGKAMKRNPSQSGGWESKGVGPIRVLKNKSTGVARILMRTEPSGKVVINCRLMSRVQYKKAQPKMAQIVVPDESGNLSTWVIRFGQDAPADELVRVCEANKAS